jgi:hypothetical protein
MFLGSDVFRQWTVIAARMLSRECERSTQRQFHGREPSSLRGENVFSSNLLGNPSPLE